jgi:hypothetical protein
MQNGFSCYETEPETQFFHIWNNDLPGLLSRCKDVNWLIRLDMALRVSPDVVCSHCLSRANLKTHEPMPKNIRAVPPDELNIYQPKRPLAGSHRQGRS